MDCCEPGFASFAACGFKPAEAIWDGATLHLLLEGLYNFLMAPRLDWQ